MAGPAASGASWSRRPAIPRFDSLQFVDSAGAWDHASKRFAFAALQHGEPILTILSMPDGDVQREQAFPDLDQIFDPTWSPAGNQIAFSGLSGGVTDLYVFDLDTAALRRLTADGFADLQPAWSPDGRTLAFTTDRFTSSLEALTFGDYRLAALDVESGSVRELPSIVGAKNIDPQWIGEDLLFIADADGVSNVFRLDVAAGAVHRLTNERSGVSGITALSPALSTAPLAGRVAYSAYRNGGYEIRTMAIATGSAYAKPLSDPAATPIASIVAAPISATPSFPTARYRGGLSLSGIGQPYLSAGGGALGGFFRAGMSVSFSDLLEQRQLQTAVQVGTSANDFAFQTAYINRRSRWTWGMVGAQLPVNFVSVRTYAGSASTIERETEDIPPDAPAGDAAGGVSLQPRPAGRADRGRSHHRIYQRPQHPELRAFDGLAARRAGSAGDRASGHRALRDCRRARLRQLGVRSDGPGPGEPLAVRDRAGRSATCRWSR